MSFTMKEIEILKRYGLGGNPVIAQVFYGWDSSPKHTHGRWGWRDYGGKKRCSSAWLRKLQQDGVTKVSFQTDQGAMADFTIKELLEVRK